MENDNEVQETYYTYATLWANSIEHCQKLLVRIDWDYRSYIVKTVKSLHLQLDNTKVRELADKYQVRPELVDQLIRIKAIGHYLFEGKKRADTSSEMANEFKKLYGILYASGSSFIDALTAKKVTVKYIEQHTVYLLDQHQGGLIIDRDGKLVATLLKNAFSDNLYSLFEKTGQLKFFNFELFGVPTFGNNKLYSVASYLFSTCVTATTLMWCFVLYFKHFNQVFFGRVVSDAAVGRLQSMAVVLLLIVLVSIAGYAIWALCHKPKLISENGLLAGVKYDSDEIVQYYRVNGQ